MRAWVIAFTLMLGATAMNEANSAEGAEFALLGDPQIGYGPGAEYADATRFRKVVDDVNAQRFDLTVIAGDLVQDRSLWQHWAFARVARHLPGNVLLVPGNHDIVDAASLAAWRKRHGADYRDLVWRDIAFIVLDSETLRDTRISAAETAAQWSFLERKLADHKAAGRNIVLAMHRPPFAQSEDEPDSDASWPRESRARLLAQVRAHGVRLILAGHLHRTVELATQDGIRIVVGAGSASSFDGSPVAYHRIRVDPGAFSVQQVVVAPAPPRPFSVRGIPGWTPRLFEFSVRHWLFTMLYGGVGVLAFLLARRRKSSRWMVVAGALFFFAVNMQLDFDEFLRETGRVGAQLTGVFAVRHMITGGVSLLMAATAVLLFARNWARQGSERLSLLALALLAPSVAWFDLAAISHHDWEMLFNEGWWDLMILVALAGIFICGAFSWRAMKRDQKLSSGRR